ncbi:MAG: hypothetical protein H0Z33_10450 [Bacillaceae bacterium]|nr:hypothetical protein [Bacillaceae bacterium]
MTGFIVVISIVAVSTIRLWAKNKQNGTAYLLVLFHLFLLSISFYFIMNVVTPELDYNHPMASEENSLQVGYAGVFWALSMMSLLAAIFRFTKLTKK